jgi:hypothetical protein
MFLACGNKRHVLDASYVLTQNRTRTNELRLSNCAPVKVSAGTVPGVPEKFWALMVPLGVSVCVCVPSAEPVKVSAGIVEVAFVGTPAGHEIAPSENAPLALVGTPAGHAIAPGLFIVGVIEETPPEGFAVVAVNESPDVGARADPPVAVDVIMCVPVVAAVVPPSTKDVTVTV